MQNPRGDSGSQHKRPRHHHRKCASFIPFCRMRAHIHTHTHTHTQTHTQHLTHDPSMNHTTATAHCARVVNPARPCSCNACEKVHNLLALVSDATCSLTRATHMHPSPLVHRSRTLWLSSSATRKQKGSRPASPLALLWLSVVCFHEATVVVGGLLS